MSELLGYAGIIAAILAFGTYLVPMRQRQRSNPLLYQWVMCNAIFCFSMVAAIALNGVTVSLYGVATGLLWTSGNVLSIISVWRTGLATASSVWMSLVVLSAFFWGIMYFGEEVSSPSMAIGGLALLIAGIGGISLIRSATPPTLIS